ncbi:MAG: DUF5658 family protein [Planctomycetota bacterium]
MTTSATASERRAGPDRRRRPTPMLSRYWLRGRRRGGRRDGERDDIYVDRYTRVEWLCVVGLLLLTAIDWAWTWAHLTRGVQEANPVMAWAWREGGALGFSTLKLGVTVPGVLVLLLHSRFRYTKWLLPAVLAIYAALMIVHALTESSIPA